MRRPETNPNWGTFSPRSALRSLEVLKSSKSHKDWRPILDWMDITLDNGHNSWMQHVILNLVLCLKRIFGNNWEKIEVFSRSDDYVLMLVSWFSLSGCVKLTSGRRMSWYRNMGGCTWWATYLQMVQKKKFFALYFQTFLKFAKDSWI